MEVNTTQLKTAASLIGFVIIAALLGGLVHNPYDPVRYGKGAIGIIQGQNIYQLGGIVYPPPFYVFSSIVIYVLSLGGSISPESYRVIATFVGIGTGTQLVGYWFGSRLVPRANNWKWVAASLLNPFVIYVIMLFGQMEPFVVLGVVGVIYAEATGRWELGGALLAAAASVKIFPGILFLPFLWRNGANAGRILRGALPIGAVTSLLMIPFLPESLTIFQSTLYGIRPVNALYILSLSLLPSEVASTVFLTSFVLVGALAAVIKTDRYVQYLLPLVPVVLFYPDVIEYRWLPLAVGALLIGYLPGQGRARLHRRYGWIWVLLGTLAMAVGTIEAWYEGDPWLVPTFGSLPTFPIPLQQTNAIMPFGDAIRAIRLIIALIFILSVLNWCRHVGYRSEIPFR